MNDPAHIQILGNGVIEVVAFGSLSDWATPGDIIKMQCISVESDGRNVAPLVDRITGKPEVYRIVERYVIIPP